MNENIVELIKSHMDSGLVLLQQEYSGLIHYIVRGILLDINDTEECISDIYIKVWHSIESYSPDKGKFSTWLTAISRNTALNYREFRGREYVELTEETPDTFSLENDVLRREQADVLKRTILTLSVKDQHIFYRKYYYLQKTVQIATEFGMTERSVEGKLYRIREKLQKKLGGDFR